MSDAAPKNQRESRMHEDFNADKRTPVKNEEGAIIRDKFRTKR